MAKYKKRKDGRYAAWVTTDEINPENGKRVRIQVYGRSVAELERKKAEVIEQTKDNSQAFQEKALQYLCIRKERDIRGV